MKGSGLHIADVTKGENVTERLGIRRIPSGLVAIAESTRLGSAAVAR